jgi:hypothetical protein
MQQLNLVVPLPCLLDGLERCNQSINQSQSTPTRPQSIKFQQTQIAVTTYISHCAIERARCQSGSLSGAPRLRWCYLMSLRGSKTTTPLRDKFTSSISSIVSLRNRVYSVVLSDELVRVPGYSTTEVTRLFSFDPLDLPPQYLYRHFMY